MLSPRRLNHHLIALTTTKLHPPPRKSPILKQPSGRWLRRRLLLFQPYKRSSVHLRVLLKAVVLVVILRRLGGPGGMTGRF